MSKNEFTLKEFFKNSDFNQIIIPEIQRDYVWEKDNVLKLLKSVFEDGKEQKRIDDLISEEELNKLSPQVKKIILQNKEQKTIYSNIGFIYGYKDKNNLFLIDGQQRLTTFYLLLLASAVFSKEQDRFRDYYFEDNNAKIDYKVRETSHQFIKQFINYILEGGNITDINNQYWCFSKYDNDKTIISIIDNYSIISDYINEHNISFEYIEDNIKMWYFGINNSKQGEELFIYMNSRGEIIQANESVKAILLSNLSDNDKTTFGEKWEEWQNFFWRNKKNDKDIDASLGFNEFLKWIKIIEYIKENKSFNISTTTKYIKILKKSEKFNSDFLNIHLVKNYFNSIKELYENNTNSIINKKWLQGETSIPDYIRLLPVLMFKNTYNFIDDKMIKRVFRFFNNINKFEIVAWDTDIYTVHSIRIMQKFLILKYQDIAEIINIEGYENILTDEERFKFNLYLNPPKNTNRDELEKTFWEAEDFNLFNGKAKLIFDACDIKFNEDGFQSFDINIFRKYLLISKRLFTKSNDLFRRALLTKGNYSIRDGYSTTLGINRYTLGKGVEEWRKILKENNNRKIIISFLKDFQKIEETGLNDDEILLKIIENYLQNTPDDNSWTYSIIKNEKTLNYCEDKKMCIGGNKVDNVVLLRKTNAVTYKEMSDFISSK